MKTIEVQYFALLREERGCSKETLKTKAATAKDLYAELQRRYAFRLPADRLKVAINEAFAEWETPLNDRDQVVFIPPVAGG